MPSRRQKKLKQGVAKARREQHYQEEYKDIEFEGDSMRSLGSLVQVSLPETGHESFRPRAQAPQPGTCAERPLKSRESRPEQNGRQMGDRVGRRPNAGDDARRQDDRRPEESYGAEKEFWGEQDRRESHTTHTFKPRSQGPAQSENEHEGGYTSSFEYEVKVRGRNGREEMRHHRIRGEFTNVPSDTTACVVIRFTLQYLEGKSIVSWSLPSRSSSFQDPSRFLIEKVASMTRITAILVDRMKDADNGDISGQL